MFRHSYTELVQLNITHEVSHLQLVVRMSSLAFPTRVQVLPHAPRAVEVSTRGTCDEEEGDATVGAKRVLSMGCVGDHIHDAPHRPSVGPEPTRAVPAADGIVLCAFIVEPRRKGGPRSRSLLAAFIRARFAEENRLC